MSLITPPTGCRLLPWLPANSTPPVSASSNTLRATSQSRVFPAMLTALIWSAMVPAPDPKWMPSAIVSLSVKVLSVICTRETTTSDRYEATAIGTPSALPYAVRMPLTLT